MKIKAHTFFIMLIFFELPLLLHPQDIQEGTSGKEASAEEEAEDYLWSYKLGDAEVDFYWDGYWKFQFSSGLALNIDDEELNWNASYPSMTQGFYFLQTPDLLLSLWIDDRYYLETSVVEDYDRNTYAIGYHGQDGEYLDSVRLGNSAISTESYAGLGVTSPEYNTPGASLKGSTDRMQNELMIRFDGTWEDRKLFIGSYEAEEQYLETYDYQRGKSFILPDSRVDNLEVYIEDSTGSYSGTDYSYRLAEEGDYLLDSDSGLLTMTENQSGRIAVYYTFGGSPVGNGGNGQNGVIPPFSGTGTPNIDEAPVPFEWGATDPYYSDLSGGSGNYAASRQDTINSKACLLIYEPDRFSPFALYNNYAYTLSLSADSWRNDIHLTGRYSTDEQEPSDLTWTLDTGTREISLYRTNTDIGSGLNRYPLGDLIPGIYGNGSVQDSRLTPFKLQLIAKKSQNGYRLGTGVVPNSVEIFVNGSREYNYSIDSDTGAIEFNRYIFPDDRIEIDFRQESLDFEGQEMLIYQGNRLLLNEQNTLETAASFNWTFPDGDDYSSDDGGTVESSVSWKREGESFNMETQISGELGLGDADGLERIMGMESALSDYPVAAENVTSACRDTTDGEFPETDFVIPDNLDAGDAPSDAPFEDQMFSLSWSGLAANEWTAGDIILNNSGTANYSTLQEIRYYMQDVSDSANTPVLLIGETGEHSDRDSSGTIDPYNEALVVKKTLSDPGTGWNQYSIILTDDDREKLSATRSLRFIVSETYSAGATGEIRVGGIELIGQTFSASIVNDSDSSAGITITEVSDSSLESSYSEEIGQFHKSGESQRVSRIIWGSNVGGSTGDLSGSEYWKAISWFDDKNISQFGKIIFFVKNDGGVHDFSLELTDLNDQGVHLDWTSSTGDAGWQKVTIDLEEGEATFDGSADNVSLDIDREVLNVNRLTLEGHNTASGIMEIDEIYFEESVIDLGGTASVAFDYKADEILTGAGGFQWLSDFFIDSRTTGSHYRQLGGLGQLDNTLFVQGTTGIDVLYTGLELQGDGTWSDGKFTLWGGHSLTVPSVPSPVTARESFALGDGDERSSFSHALSLDLIPVESLVLDGGHESSQQWNKLSQEWSVSIAYKPESWRTGGRINFAEKSLEPLRGAAFDDTQIREDYFGVWDDSWEYLIPDRTDVVSRTVSEQFSLSRLGDVLDLDFSASAGTQLSYSPRWTQTSTLSWSLDLPLTLNQEKGIILTPAYSRSLTRSNTEDFSSYFSSDFTNWADVILADLPLYNFIPFREIWFDEPVESRLSNRGSSSYNPSFTLSLERNYSSRIYDLFIPYFAETAFSRSYVKKTDSFYYNNTWDFTLRQRAMNLFGEFGVYRAFSFYATEEIANTFTYTLAEQNSLLPEPDSLSWNSYSLFRGTGPGELSLENDLSYDFAGSRFTESINTAYSWERGRKSYRKIPLSRYIVDRESYMKHSESAGYSLTGDNADREHETLINHTSTLYIDNFGTVKSWLKIGCTWDRAETLVGTELGVEIMITF